MSKKYERRVSELIQRHLTELLRTRVNDPRLSLVTITDVDVNADTTQAQVYFTALGGPEAREETMEGLESANGFLRRELAQSLRLRNTPELIFRWDDAFERGERISTLLDQLKIDESSPDPETE